MVLLVIVKLSLVTLWSILLGQVAQAVPSPYGTNFPPLQLVNDTGATLMRDSDDERRVWVMPPQAGTTQLTGFVQSANLAFCDGLKNLAAASNDIDARIGKLAARQESLLPELEAAERELQEAHRQLGKQAESQEMRAILELQERQTVLEESRQQIATELESCRESCDELRQEFKRLGMEVQVVSAELRALSAERREQVRAYELAHAAVVQAELRFDNVGRRYQRLTQDLAKLSSMVHDLYATKGKLEGGYALINYNTGWDQAVAALEARYPDHDFEKVPTYNARIFGNIVGAANQGSYYESLPMILDYTISGMPYLPWVESYQQRSALQSVITGTLRLSTLGACPLHDPEFFAGTSVNPERAADGTPLFAIGASYEYPVAFKHRIVASYNLYKFFDVLKRSGTEGGFFSSQAYANSITKKIDRDAFKIQWASNDPDQKISPAERQQIELQLKQDLMNRVLLRMGQPAPVPAGGEMPVSVGLPPKAGAVVLAKGLNATCGLHLYCQGASWLLSGLAATFQSTEQQQRIKEEWNRTVEEEWSNEIATLRAGATGFSSRRNDHNHL